MKKIFAGVLGLTIATALVLNTAAESIKQWNYAKDIQLKGENKYKVVTLDQDVYKFAKPDLSDLRVADQKGQFVPYYIQNENVFENAFSETYSAKQTSKFKVKNDTVIDYNVLPNEAGADVRANRIVFTSENSNFLKDIIILGSYDGLRWENILQTQIYDIQNIRKMYADLPDVYKYKFYRISIKNNLEGINITGIQPTFTSSQVLQEQFTKQGKLDYSVKNQGKETLIFIKNPNKLRVSGINLSTDGNFKRSYTAGASDGKNITNYLAEGTLYNLKFKDINVTDTYIRFGTQPSNTNFEVIINNNDDKPLSIKDVKADYYLDRLVFEGDNSTSYRLYFGNQDAQKPLYDVETYRNHIEKENKDECTLGNLAVLNNTAAKNAVYDYSKIFNIVIVIISLLLIGLILAKVSSKAKNNVE